MNSALSIYNTDTTTNSNAYTPVFSSGNTMRGRVCPPCVQIFRGGEGNPLWLRGDAVFLAQNTFYASFLGVEASYA